MAETDQQLAERIAAVSVLSYGDALAALEKGGKMRDLALSIVDHEEQYKQDRAELAKARKKLREAVPV